MPAISIQGNRRNEQASRGMLIWTLNLNYAESSGILSADVVFMNWFESNRPTVMR